MDLTDEQELVRQTEEEGDGEIWLAREKETSYL